MRKTQSFCSVIYAVRARTLYESSVFWGLMSGWGGGQLLVSSMEPKMLVPRHLKCFII